MISSIKKPSFISSGRGYFLSDGSDKNASLGIFPKNPFKAYFGMLKSYKLVAKRYPILKYSLVA